MFNNYYIVTDRSTSKIHDKYNVTHITHNCVKMLCWINNSKSTHPCDYILKQGDDSESKNKESNVRHLADWQIIFY